MIIDRRECSVLSLVLTRKWYDMIASGRKREEYRLATEYWRKRLWNWNLAVSPRIAPVVEFRCGYARDARRMAFWVFGQRTVGGLMSYSLVTADNPREFKHPEWGEPDDAHYVIKLGVPVEFDKSKEVMTEKDLVELIAEQYASPTKERLFELLNGINLYQFDRNGESEAKV